jgi:hypothetical protein
MVIVGRKKHLGFVFEPAKRRTVQNSGFVAKKFEAERIAFDGELSPQRLRALLCKRRKLFLVLAEDSNDVEFGFHEMPFQKITTEALRSQRKNARLVSVHVSDQDYPTGR